MRFTLPDITSLPITDCEIYTDDLGVPEFSDLWEFEKDLQKLIPMIQNFYNHFYNPSNDVNMMFFDNILKHQISKIIQSYNKYMSYQLIQRTYAEIGSEGIISTMSDVSTLQDFFKKDILQLQATKNTEHKINKVDRAVTRKDPPALRLVQDFLNKSGVLGNLENKVLVEAVVVHLSRPDDTHHYQTFQDLDLAPTKLLNLHMDPKPGVIKSIIYLNEVTKDTGPFQAVKGSNRWSYDEVERIFAWGNSTGNYCQTSLHRKVACSFPERFRKTSIIGRLLKDDTDLSNFFLENLTTYTTDTDNVMFFDPNFIWHRGGMVSKGERINLQVIMRRDLT